MQYIHVSAEDLHREALKTGLSGWNMVEMENGTLQDADSKGVTKLAERAGFEPAVQLPIHTLSKRAP